MGFLLSPVRLGLCLGDVGLSLLLRDVGITDNRFNRAAAEKVEPFFNFFILTRSFLGCKV